MIRAAAHDIQRSIVGPGNKNPHSLVKNEASLYSKACFGLLWFGRAVYSVKSSPALNMEFPYNFLTCFVKR